jgi:hypothetical protein
MDAPFSEVIAQDRSNTNCPRQLGSWRRPRPERLFAWVIMAEYWFEAAVAIGQYLRDFTHAVLCAPTVPPPLEGAGPNVLSH